MLGTPTTTQEATMTYHVSTWRRCGQYLPKDLDGYTHTSIREWLAAPLYCGAERRYDCARELAREAREAIAEADAAVSAWRREVGA
jgi:NAD(P)H-dependent FMN reductase